MTTNSQRRRDRQGGSALLIVLVLAAMVAIMLYEEMPVVTFEAQRQKEELLMDRGNEYKRAIKLYVRKFQTFPPSIQALESTNRLRFLRNKYVDPYTGKDDWRLLHAGPGGMIVDSKIKQNGTGLNGAAGAPGSNSGSTLGAPSTVTNPFANSFDGANGTGQVGGPNPFPQRPPAILANGGGSPVVGSGDGGVTQQVDPAQDPAANGVAAPDPSQNGGQPGGYPMGPGGRPFPGGRFGGNLAGNGYSPGQFGGAAAPQDPSSVMQSALNTQNPPPAVQNGPTNGSGFGSSTSSAFGSNTGSSFGSNTGSAFGSNTGGAFGNSPNGSNGTQMGTMGNGGTMGGGIAGVASKAPGRTIKVLNDQTDRALWEFVYDMQKELQANAAGLGNGIGGGLNGGQNNAFGNNSGNQPSSFSGSGSSFNQNQNNNGFGSGFNNSQSIVQPSPTQPLPAQPTQNQ